MDDERLAKIAMAEMENCSSEEASDTLVTES